MNAVRVLAFLFVIQIPGCASPPNTLAGAATLGGFAAGSKEVNLEMDAGDSLTYEWSVAEQNATVSFNIHVHRDGRIEEFDAGDFHSRNGSYVQESSGGVSLFWENPGPEAVHLEFRLEGGFRVVSP